MSSSRAPSRTVCSPQRPTIHARRGSTNSCDASRASTPSVRTATLAGPGWRLTGYNVLLMLRSAGAGVLAALALVATSCSGDESKPASQSTKPAGCPQAWKAGWQRLANRIHATVYCPTWMPSPLDAKMGGQWDNGISVEKDKSYLVSFLWHEPPSQDVHVNFRGYPGRTKIPRCEDTEVVGGKVRRTTMPCFSDPHGTRRIGDITATLYTVNRGVDQWHLLYAWHDHGSLYAVSEHVIKPLTYRKVLGNLDRLVHGLVAVKPTN